MSRIRALTRSRPCEVSTTKSARYGRAGSLSVLEEFLPRGGQHRMDDLFELLHRRWIVHHARGKLVAIDLAANGRAGKRRFDRWRRLAFVNLVHGRIGIVDRDAGVGEQLCGG